MKTGFRAVWEVIRVALYGWILALIAMIRRLFELIRRDRADDRGERERNAVQARCVPVKDPAHVRPDPLVYSQKYLRERGLNVTWQNPDFFMRRSGAPVDSHELEPDTSDDVTVRVWNASVDGPAIDMPVHLSFLSFGAGTQTHPIDTKRIDVGVKGGANEPAFVTFEWTTPPEPGHYCLQALLDPIDDAEYGNNLGQHNTNVVETQSPGVFSFMVGNDTPRRHEYHFAIDTYELPSARPCKDPVKGIAARQDHPIDSAHLIGHPLPSGWSVDLDPDHPSIAPGDEEQILVTVTPPDDFGGADAEQIINVHALFSEYYEDRVAGGVTVTIRAGADVADNFKQYTSCSKPSNWVSLAVYITIATVPLLIGAAIVIAAAGWCALFYLLVLAAAESVVVCLWWLNVRLICLGGGGDRSAIGMLVSVEPSDEKEGLFNELDTDYSINLLLYPTLPGVDQTTAEASTPFGELIRDQNVGDGFDGETAKEPGRVPDRESAVLHAEFEGAGIRDFLIGASISFGLALAALIACAAIPPPWGIVVAAILAILAFLAWLLGYLLGAGDYADPTETEGTPSEFHLNAPTEGVGADLLYVQGSWVYDSLHEGWNEIHPIKKCALVDTWDGAWPDDIEDKLKRFDAAFDDARSDATIDRQSRLQHRWEIHPLVDGCGEYPEPDEPAGPM